MRGLLDEDETELSAEHIFDTTGLTHPGWVSTSLFRMWRKHRGVWHHTMGPTDQWRTVTHAGCRHALVATGMPYMDEHRGTAALQRHFLLTSDARAAVMSERLETAREGSGSAGASEEKSDTGHASKKVCVRMFSNKSATFGGGRERHSRIPQRS